MNFGKKLAELKRQEKVTEQLLETQRSALYYEKAREQVQNVVK